MRPDFERVFSINKFFRVLILKDTYIKYNLRIPSILLLNNIYYSWLYTICQRVPKNKVMFTSKNSYECNRKSIQPFGYLDTAVLKYSESTLLEQNADCLSPKSNSPLNVKIIVPQHETMQYFLQWQRYRKYWWSSITTTPGLFAINEINYEDNAADANITAQFPWAQYTVETITTRSEENSTSCITCSTTLETALLILLQDGLCNSSKEEYLKLHRNMAPYKISFALNFKDDVNKQMLHELVQLIYFKLNESKISSFLPNFSLTFEQQVIENLQLGVAYTIVLCESTLTNGIFWLINSSTKLKEQVHLADFMSYASLLCK